MLRQRLYRSLAVANADQYMASLLRALGQLVDTAREREWWADALAHSEEQIRLNRGAAADGHELPLALLAHADLLTVSGRTPDAEPHVAEALVFLRQVAAGQTNKSIALKLGISEHTVKFHLGSAMTKLGAASRAEAVAVAIRRGLISV